MGFISGFIVFNICPRNTCHVPGYSQPIRVVTHLILVTALEAPVFFLFPCIGKLGHKPVISVPGHSSHERQSPNRLQILGLRRPTLSHYFLLPLYVQRHFPKMNSKVAVGIANINVNDIVCVIDIDDNDLSMWPPKKTTLILLWKIHFIPTGYSLYLNSIYYINYLRYWPLQLLTLNTGQIKFLLIQTQFWHIC